MANEIYHRSNWGNAVNDIAWGDVYEKFDATNEMFVRSDNYENSNETDKLMAAINPKPSILLTPTAYDNGSLHSVKPVQSFGSELITNGDFATDSDWTKGSSWTIANGKATATNSTTGSIYQDVLDTSKTYKATFEITEITSGSLRIGIGVNFSNYFTETGTYTHYGQPTTDGLLRINPSSGTNASIDNVSVQEIQTDVPRIDFTDTSKGALLLEPQSTNVLENSEITSNWTYTEYGSGSSGTITTGKTDMFGGTNAAQIDFPADAENVTLAFGQTTSSISSGSVSGSVYIKLVESGSKTLQLRCSPALTNLVNVDTTKFVRYQLSGTKNNNEAFNLKLRPSAGTSSGGFSIIVCQPQEEALPYATSYIPTNGSPVTRNAELCNNSGSAQDFNSEEGVLYCEIAALDNDGTIRRISLSDGGTSNRLEIFYGTIANRIDYNIYSNSSFQASGFSLLSSATDFNKIAVKYKENDFALWVNGTEASTDTSGNTPIGLNKLQLQAASGSNDFYGKVREVQVFTEALTDEQLQKLTS